MDQLETRGHYCSCVMRGMLWVPLLIPSCWCSYPVALWLLLSSRHCLCGKWDVFCPGIVATFLPLVRGGNPDSATNLGVQEARHLSSTVRQLVLQREKGPDSSCGCFIAFLLLLPIPLPICFLQRTLAQTMTITTHKTQPLSLVLLAESQT